MLRVRQMSWTSTAFDGGQHHSRVGLTRNWKADLPPCSSGDVTRSSESFVQLLSQPAVDVTHMRLIPPHLGTYLCNSFRRSP